MFMLILLLLLCSSSNTHEEHDLKGFMELNNTDINTDSTKLLLQLVIDMRSELKEYVKKEDMRSELKECVKKNELPELMETITPSPEPMNEQTHDTGTGSTLINKQYRMPGAPLPTKAPVVPAANMSSMDLILKLLVRRSCYEWRVSGFETSGIYSIDPDGQGVGDPPLIVYCDMITGFTLIRHDMEGVREPTQCTGPTCYKVKINYNASEVQIKTLIEMSQSCQQFIKVECFESPFQTEEEVLAYWKGRDGLEHYEWVGENYPNHTCACGLSEACVNPVKSCNCDSDISNIWVSDYGYVSNQTALPVQEIAFGTKDSYTPLQVKYSIGPLQCYGFKSLSYPTSCLDVFLRGSVRSGWYVLGNPETVHFAFCDMSAVYEAYDKLESPVEPINIDIGDLVVRNLQSKGFIILKETQLNDMIKSEKSLENNVYNLINQTVSSFQKKTEETGNYLAMIRDLVQSNENRLLNLSYNLETFKEQVENASSIKVAFHADTYKDWSATTVMKFEVVRMNQDNGYNPETGIFTAPVTGVYYIAAYGLKETVKDGVAWYEIRRNGYRINFAQSYEKPSSTMGIAGIVYLIKGDEVDVNLGGGVINGGLFKGTSFLGFLLYFL